MLVSIMHFTENLGSLLRFSDDSPWRVALLALFVEVPITNKEGTGFLAQLFKFFIFHVTRSLQCFQIAPKNEVIAIILRVMQIYPRCGGICGSI